VDGGYEMAKQYALLLDGTSLPVIFGDQEMADILIQVFDCTASVVVFRCSPDEKAQMIQFVQKHNPKAFCCAIGDGANDINMIQVSQVGVGIEGNEGNQAAFFSDYSIPEFQGIRRLLLWHGRSFGLKTFSVFVP